LSATNEGAGRKIKHSPKLKKEKKKKKEKEERFE
jgi:hypothetical protein